MPFYEVTVEQRFVGTQLVEGKDKHDVRNIAIKRARNGNFNKRFTGAEITQIKETE